MRIRILRQITSAAVIAAALSSQALAQTPQTRVEGVIHDFTAALDASGPWQIVGEWTLAVNTASGKVEFQAALNMVRSENASRQAHTHHVAMTDGQVTPIAGGYRISGTAAITSNGALAGFTGSPLDIEITGGSALNFSNLKVTFGGSAVGHFGDQPLEGVVNFRR
jgi:hypothetical protein